MGQTDAGLTNHCSYCSNPPYNFIVHYGPCPRIRAIEYYPNGSLKRVELHGEEQIQPVSTNVGSNEGPPIYGVPPDGYNG